MIERLNTRWDLQITPLHGQDASKALNSNKIERQCASYIRALCWQGRIDILDDVLEDFEEGAKQMHSDWISKYYFP